MLKEYKYIINDEGKKVLDTKSENDRIKQYLSSLGLYPFEFTRKAINNLILILSKEVDLRKPTIFIYDEDIHKSLFSALLVLVGRLNEQLYGDKAPFCYCKVTNIGYVTQQYLSGEYHDVSLEFENYEVLFVTLNTTDFPHMYNPYGIRNLAESRKAQGKYTFFFFLGDNADIHYDKWKIDETGSGQKGVFIDSNNNKVDTRVLTSLEKYVSFVNLKQILKITPHKAEKEETK